MAGFMLKYPAHKLTTSFHAWARGEKKQLENFERGQIRPIGKTDGMSKKVMMTRLLEESMGEPRLVAATAAATNREAAGQIAPNTTSSSLIKLPRLLKLLS